LEVFTEEGGEIFQAKRGGGRSSILFLKDEGFSKINIIYFSTNHDCLLKLL
jgi:hypothetical protein